MGESAKVPVGPVEGEAVIDHARHKARPAAGAAAPHQRAVEHALAAVGVGGPLVEYQDGAEILQVGHLREERVGQEIVDRGALGVAGVARAEMPARSTGTREVPERQVHLGVGGRGTRA